MALTIAQIATEHQSLSALAQALTSYLATALRVESVALFWRQQKERRGAGPPSLSLLAVSTREGQAGAAAGRLKLAAYRQVVASRPIARFEPPSTANGVLTGRYVVALSVCEGDAAPILALDWHGAHEPGHTWIEQVATLCAPTLSMALRPVLELEAAQRAEQSARPRRSVFALTSEAVVSIGEDLSILETNPAFGRVLGWPEGATLGRQCAEVLHCRDVRNVLLCGSSRCPVRHALDTVGEIPISNVSWQTSEGRLRDVSASISIHPGPMQSRAVVVARDVTALNAADRMRSNFISMVSHELRTPLNSMNGFLEIVAEEQVGPLNERQHEFLSYARQSTQQLTTLVEDVLFITKADSGEFKLRKTDVEIPQVIAQAINGQAVAAQKADVRVVVEAPAELPLLRVDELRLQQVLNNLLSNAIKFSPAGSEVRIRIRVDGGNVSFAIQDAGVGVAPEEQARIFDRFYQSESALKSRGGGYGLGLAIAKLIVEQHGGTIWVENAPGSGAAFCFTVPIAASAADSSRET